jgi:formate-nitrite transporter family protein
MGTRRWLAWHVRGSSSFWPTWPVRSRSQRWLRRFSYRSGAAAFATIGAQVVKPAWTVIFGSAVLAGWLMGLLTWLVAAARETVSQLLLVGLVTWMIGFARLHHSIAGSVEVFATVFVGAGTLGDCVHFLVPATLGNAVGGVVFVAIMRFGHAIRTSD